MVATFAKFWPGGQKLRLMNESFLVSGPTFRHSKVTCQNPEIAQKSSFFFPVFYMFLNKFLSTYHLNIIKIWPNIIQIPSKISIFGPILRLIPKSLKNRRFSSRSFTCFWINSYQHIIWISSKYDQISSKYHQKYRFSALFWDSGRSPLSGEKWIYIMITFETGFEAWIAFVSSIFVTYENKA